MQAKFSIEELEAKRECKWIQGNNISVHIVSTCSYTSALAKFFNVTTIELQHHRPAIFFVNSSNHPPYVA
jgi:hypothetical protein